MSVLVTGGAGFIGSHFIEHLLDQGDARIVCLDNFNDYYAPELKRANVAAFEANDRVTVVEADFCNREVVRQLFQDHRVENVVHLGAYAGVHASVSNPHIYQRANVEGTLTLLEAAREHSISRFLLASSSTVYGTGAEIPFTEDAPLGIPASPYGATKRAAELLGLTYHQLFGLPVVCLRPFSVYGPRLRPDLAMSIFTMKILSGEPIQLYGDGTVRRDFTHVRDICSGISSALTSSTAVGQEINIGHSSPIEIRELIERLECAAGKKAIVEHRPARPEDLPVTFANLEKAERLLGYRPVVTLDDGIPGYVNWFRKWHEG